MEKFTRFRREANAIDLAIEKHPDGTFKSTGWYVQFKGFRDFLVCPDDKVVTIQVNGKEADFFMCLDDSMEAYFIKEANSEGNTSNSSEEQLNQSPFLQFVRTRVPSDDQIDSLKLKEGQNSVSFTLSNSVLGVNKIKAFIFFKHLSNRSISTTDVDVFDGTTSNEDTRPETTMNIIRIIRSGKKLRKLQAQVRGTS